MFEKLGYEYDECYFEDTLDEIYYQKEGKYTPQIKFSLNHKVIRVYREDNKASSFGIKLLQAINKQVDGSLLDNEKIILRMLGEIDAED